MRKKQTAASNPLTEGTSGSPHAGGPEFLVVGYLRRAHGLRGEMLMDILTDFPDRITQGKKIYLGETHREMTIRSIRPNNKVLLIAFEGFDTPENAGTLRNQNVYVRTDQVPPLPEGEYYHHELLGLKVVDESGKYLGILDEILETGANDVYVIKDETGHEILIPAVPDYVKNINLEVKEIIVSLPQWS